MALSSRDLQRRVYFDPSMREHVCIAFLETPEARLVLAVTKNKHRALAVRNGMQLAAYRFNCGPLMVEYVRGY